MTAEDRYDAGAVADYRAQVEGQVAAWDQLYAELSTDTTPGVDALASFEPTYFAALVQGLELRFVNRSRSVEGKDGNPLNEVRLLAASIAGNDGRLLADARLGLDPARSVLGLAPGDDIVLRRDDFVRLAGAFFREIEARYVRS